MSERQRLLLLGGTGLVGSHVLSLAAQTDAFALLGLSRREFSVPRGVRFELIIAEPEGWGEAIDALRPDIVINALGTTRAKAGSREAFVAVDHELVLSAGRAAKSAGAHHFVHMSSVGADANARAFYLRVKGQVEQELRKLKFARLDILRPGLLRGARKGDFRLMESIAMMASPVTDNLLHGGARKYRSIAAAKVAMAAMQAAREKARGQFVHEHDSLQMLAARFRRDA